MFPIEMGKSITFWREVWFRVSPVAPPSPIGASRALGAEDYPWGLAEPRPLSWRFLDCVDRQFPLILCDLAHEIYSTNHFASARVSNRFGFPLLPTITV
jgi:hypothetical protein